MRTMVMLAGIGATALGGGLWVALGGSTAQAQGLIPYTDAEAVLAGQDIYVAACASCHGADLEGQPDWRRPLPNGRLPAPPHDETGHTWHHPDELLFMLTKYGPAELVGNGYESDMPGFDGVLSDEEILAVLAYIKSTWPERIIARHDQMNAAR